MANTIPQAFFAYPSRTPTLKEAIHGAVPELNEKGQVNIRTWEQCNIGGKFVIDTICNAIDEAELFLADLTGLNANVMFELGYAIACGKRIWLILDDTYTKEKDMFEQLKILTTVGYVSCCNSQNIVSGFYKDKPFADIENTIFRAPIEPNLKPYSILYLKSQHENQAALYMSNLLQERCPEKIIVDAPNKPAVQSLADYGNLVFSCSALVCHFTNPAREDAYLQTSRHALICGMAHGFEKPLLMLAEGEFSSPIDYRDFLKHYKTASEALGYLEEWLLRAGQTLKAKQEVTDESTNTKVQNDPSEMEVHLHDAHAYFNQGNICQSKGDYDHAIEAFNKAIELKPDDADTYHNRGFTYHVKGDYDRAIEDYTKAIQLNPDSAEAYYNRGNAYREKGDFDHAVIEYTKAIQLNPDYIAAYSNRGIAYHGKGDFDRAIEDYTKAIQLNPDSAEAYYNRGSAYGNKGDFDRAIGDLNKAIQLNPDSAEVYSNRGVAYHGKGDFDRAIGDYTKAAKLNPDSTEIYYNRGNAYREKGDFDYAIADYTKAIELKPDYANAYCNRGVAYTKKGDFDYAIADYTKAIELDPDFAAAYNNRGTAYSDRSEYKRAIADYTKAIDLKPDYVEAYYNRGNAYGKQSDYGRAIADYIKAINLNPNYASTHYNRGRVWLHLREWVKAKSDLMSAREKGVDIITAFHNDYGSVEGFEQITGIQLPVDITEMLTPQQ